MITAACREDHWRRWHRVSRKCYKVIAILPPILRCWIRFHTRNDNLKCHQIISNNILQYEMTSFFTHPKGPLLFHRTPKKRTRTRFHLHQQLLAPFFRRSPGFRRSDPLPRAGRRARPRDNTPWPREALEALAGSQGLRKRAKRAFGQGSKEENDRKQTTKWSS